MKPLEPSSADRDLGKLKGLLILVVPLCIALLPVRSVLIVLVLHGFVGYSQGIRVASLKPARLSNGELVPPILDFASGIATFLVAACVVYYSVAALNRLLIRIGVFSEPEPSADPSAQRQWAWHFFWPALVGFLICASLTAVGPGSLQHVFAFFAAGCALYTFVSAAELWRQRRRAANQ